MVTFSNGYLKINYYYLAQLMLCAIMVFAYVGLSPFSQGDMRLDLDESGYGNTLRQIVFLLIWSLSLLCFYKIGRVYDLLIFKGLILILLWCGLSVFWATEPAISLRRVILLGITTTTLMMLVHMIEEEDLFKTLSYLYATLLFFSILSIPVLPGAVHSHAELFDSGLAGNWKGVFLHKNVAASAIAFGIMLFIYRIIGGGNYFYLPFILLGLFFIYFTESKTTTALIFPSILFGLSMIWIIKRPLLKKVVWLIMLVVLLFLIILSEHILYFFLNVLDDPQAFTGRATIWSLMYLAIIDYFWFGLGYGSVWRVGDGMLLTQYAFGRVDWVFTLSHGHNSYLDLLLSLGFLGFILVMGVLIIKPFYELMLIRNPGPAFVFLYCSVLFFIVFHGLLETNFLYPDNGRWFLFLIVYLSLMKRLSCPCEK